MDTNANNLTENNEKHIYHPPYTHSQRKRKLDNNKVFYFVLFLLTLADTIMFYLLLNTTFF